MNLPHRTLVVCADDFGASPALTQPMLDLAQAGRLTAISCLSTHAAWRRAAPALAGLPLHVSRGLHFNLSEGAPLSTELRRIWPQLPGLAWLIAAAHARQLPLAAIAAEWRAQWAAFVDASGQMPGHVDGHQHVHQLPGVRDVVLAALPQGVAVRHTGRVCGPGFAFKRGVMAATGGRALGRALRLRGVPHNTVLGGVYDFTARVDYRALMQRWLQALPATGGLLFCHPGPARAEPGDAIGPARAREAAYLASGAFVDDLREAGVSLVAPAQRPSAG